MKYYLILDDVRSIEQVKRLVDLPLVDWVLVKDYVSFKRMITLYGCPEFVSYDHDLGTEAYEEYANSRRTGIIDYSKLSEKTGYDCAKDLVELCMRNNIPHPPYAIHSMNSIGRANIDSYIKNYNNSLTK